MVGTYIGTRTLLFTRLIHIRWQGGTASDITICDVLYSASCLDVNNLLNSKDEINRADNASRNKNSADLIDLPATAAAVPVQPGEAVGRVPRCRLSEGRSGGGPVCDPAAGALHLR